MPSAPGSRWTFIIGTVLEAAGGRSKRKATKAVELSAKDGRKLTGYIVARDATGRDPPRTRHTAAETKLAPRRRGPRKRAIGSFMPAGLVDRASPEPDLRDLFRYLSELGESRR